jgi:mRNA interferase MazF
VADRIGSVGVVALTRTHRGLVSELSLSAQHDRVPTDCVVNFDRLHTLAKESFRRRITALTPLRMAQRAGCSSPPPAAESGTIVTAFCQLRRRSPTRVGFVGGSHAATFVGLRSVAGFRYVSAAPETRERAMSPLSIARLITHTPDEMSAWPRGSRHHERQKLGHRRRAAAVDWASGPRR